MTDFTDLVKDTANLWASLAVGMVAIITTFGIVDNRKQIMTLILYTVIIVCFFPFQRFVEKRIVKPLQARYGNECDFNKTPSVANYADTTKPQDDIKCHVLPKKIEITVDQTEDHDDSSTFAYLAELRGLNPSKRTALLSAKNSSTTTTTATTTPSKRKGTNAQRRAAAILRAKKAMAVDKKNVEAVLARKKRN